MSTTGHYTRYINQYPGWSDNCDSMYQGIYENDVKIGYLTVVHTYGNKYAYCTFTGDLAERYGYFIRHETVIEYTGRMAIQNVLEMVPKTDIEKIVSDITFKALNFYMFAYIDYQERLNNPEKYDRYNQKLSDLNEWLDCDSHHCILSDNPFTCGYMVEGTRSGVNAGDKNKVCKYFESCYGSLKVTA